MLNGPGNGSDQMIPGMGSPAAMGTTKQPQVFENPPDLHTAAANKMLHCWPRIRLYLTLPDLNPQTYLQDTDAADRFLIEPILPQSELPRLSLWQVDRALNHFYDATLGLPIGLVQLLNTHESLGRIHIFESMAALYPPGSSSPHTISLDPHRLSVEQLLVMSMALKLGNPTALGAREADVQAASAFCFSLAMQRQWTLHANPEILAPLSLTMTYCLIHFWARPFHALGILRSIDSAIKQLSMRSKVHT